MVKRTTYTRYEGTPWTYYRGEHIGSEYKTSRVHFKWPIHIERVYRFLWRFCPDSKYLLDWNMYSEPSFGLWLRFDEDRQTIQLVSKCAHFLSHDNLDIVWSIDTPLKLRLALRGIMDVLVWYGNIREQRNPLKGQPK